MSWSDKLAKLVTYCGAPSHQANGAAPFYVWVDQPVPFEWPAALPIVDSLHRFYSTCGGGEFGPMIRFIPAARLAEETASWVQTLRGYDERGDILVSGRHIVFAKDAEGTPWIVDASTGRVASFYWKDGDWEDPQFASHDEFMEWIFGPGSDDPDWASVLQIVLGTGT